MTQDAEAVQLRSYLIWESEGRPLGRDVDHWLQAEAELASETRKASKAKKSASPKAPKTRARKASATTKKKTK